MYQPGYARYAERGLVPAEKRDLSGYASAIDRATTDSDSSVRRLACVCYARALMRTRTDQSADAALREWTWLSDHMYDDDEVRKQLFVYYSVIGNTQTTSWQEFATGEYAFAENGTWQLANAKKAGFDYGVIPISGRPWLGPRSALWGRADGGTL